MQPTKKVASLFEEFKNFALIVKFLGWIARNKKEESAAPPPLTTDQRLLSEIRDLLQKAATPSAPR